MHPSQVNGPNLSTATEEASRQQTSNSNPASKAILPSQNAIASEAKPATVSFEQQLAETLCLVTDSDQGLVATASLDGLVHELAQHCSQSETSRDWSTWPETNEIVATILHQHTALGQADSLWFGEQLPIALPGPLLGLCMSSGRKEHLVICLRRAPGGPAFTPREAKLLQHLVKCWQACISMVDRQFLSTVQLLTQIAQFGGSQRDLGEVLRYALRELGRYVPGALVTIWILQTNPEPRLRPICSSELPSFWRKTSKSKPRLSLDDSGALPRELSSDTGPLAPVIQKLQIVYLDDLAKQTEVELQQWAKLGFTACVAIPLRVGNEPIGALVLLSQRSVGLTHPQIQLAHAVADLLAPLIAWHQLNERFKQAYEQLQRAHQQLANAEKMRALGEMASGMAHDFNNALCGTLGFLELALKDPQLPHRVEELLEMAHTCAVDASATVRRVQDFTRWDRGLQAAELLSVNDLVRHVVTLTRPRWQTEAQASGRIIEMQLELQANHPVLANPSELREVLTNLIFNAVDAMPQGGRITITTASDSQSVIIRVSDTGTGMSPEVQQRLFEPFFTTKKERGTGLGLSVSYAIIKRHGGQITVESQPRRGSTFTIHLPLPREITAEVTANSSQPPASIPPPMQVLVVDDEPHVLAFLRQCLLHLGHSPDTFSDAEQALAQLARKQYDLVITDYGMPKLNGQQVAQQVYRHNPDTPVILLTGWGEHLQHGQAPPPNLCHVLAKPITIEQLKQTLQHMQQRRK